MTTSMHLPALAGGNETPPFGFDEFEARRAAVRHRHRTAGWSAAAALGVLAIVPVLAVITRPAPSAHVLGPPPGAMTPLADVFQQPPALVDMSRFAVTAELEDYIALLDAEISAARLTPVPREELRRLEATRAELHESLQHVARAHSVLEL